MVAGAAALYWSVGRILEGWSSAGCRVVSALPRTAASRLVEWGKTWPSGARTGNVTASPHARSTAFLWLSFVVASCSRKNRIFRLHRRKTGRLSKPLTHPPFGFFAKFITAIYSHPLDILGSFVCILPPAPCASHFLPSFPFSPCLPFSSAQTCVINCSLVNSNRTGYVCSMFLFEMSAILKTDWYRRRN